MGMNVHKWVSFKRKMALWLAVVMVFGLVTPFGVGRVDVSAQHPATGARLSAHHVGRLVYGEIGAGFTQFRTVPGGLPNGSVLLAWHVPVAANNTGMYVLRYFTELGDKVELWVIHNPDMTEDQISIQHRVFRRVEGAVGTAVPLYHPPNPAHVVGDVDIGTGRYSVRPGQGVHFICPALGQEFRFLWNTGSTPGVATPAGSAVHNFMFYINDLTLGLVYDFTLEFFTGNHAAAYRNSVAPAYFADSIHAVAWQNDGVRAVEGWPRYVTNNNDRTFVFTGFGVDDMQVIPFAASEGHTRNTPIAGWNTAPASLPEHSLGLAADKFNIDPLNMVGLAADITEYPGMQVVGFDIRLVMPRFFSEYYGRFVTNFLDMWGNANALPGVPPGLMINMGTLNEAYRETTEAFTIGIALDGLNNLDNHNLIAHTSNRIRLGLDANPDPTCDMIPIEIYDVEMLRIGTDELDVLRIEVIGLMPSIVYNEVQVGFGVPAVNTFFRPQGGSQFAHMGDDHVRLNLNTLLHFTLPNPVAGMANFRVTPFRWHCESVRVLAPTNVLTGVYYFTPNYGLDTTPLRITAGADLADVFYIPVSFGAHVLYDRVYQIDFQAVGANLIESQSVIIQPVDRPSLGAPNVFDVTRERYQLRRIPTTQGVTGILADLDLQVHWQLGTTERIYRMFEQWDDDGHVVGSPDYNEITVLYRIYVSDSPEPGGARSFAYIRMRLFDRQNAPIRFNVEYSVFLTDEVPGGDGARVKQSVPIHTTTPSAITPIGFVYGQVLIPNLTVMCIQELLSPGAAQPDFRFPSSYFMYIVPVGVYRGPTANPIPLWDEVWPRSPIRSITLEGFDDLPPPPPENLLVRAQPSPHAPPSLTVQFDVPVSALQAYMRPLYDFDALVYFNVYISANEIALNHLAEPSHNRRDLRNPQTPEGDYTQTRNITLTADNVIITTVDDNQVVTLRLDEDDLEYLREGGIIRIQRIPMMARNDLISWNWLDWDDDQLLDASFAIMRAISGLTIPGIAVPVTDPWRIQFNIEGLDENQQYFAFGDTVVERFVHPDIVLDGAYESARDRIFERVDRAYALPRRAVIRRSVPTEVMGYITIGTPQQPGPEEIDPSAPTNIGSINVGQSYATIFWDYIASDDVDLVAIEFEIVRLTHGRAQLEEWLNPDGAPMTLANIVARNPGAVAWRTHVNMGDFAPYGAEPTDLPFMYVYRGGTSERISLGDADSLFQFHTYFEDEYLEPNGHRVALTDRTLHPNHMYFYYVRVVRRVIFEGVNDPLENRSSWVEESVTTSVVQPPQNLRAEDGDAQPGFDPQSQFFVSWRMETYAELRNIINSLSYPNDHNEGLVFQYQLRIDDDLWGEIRTVPHSVMINPNSVQGERFYFMLRGLNPGTSYQVRVRVFDRALGDASLWSNIISFMTDWCDEDFLLERDADNWLEHLRRLLLEHLRRPFWVASDTPELLRLVYRPEAFRGLVDTATGAVQLYNTNAPVTIYYLPISGIVEANNARRGVSTRYADMDIVFAPGFLSQDHNRAIMDMTRHVDDRNAVINDYFVRITLVREPFPGFIHGAPPLGDAVEVRIDLVGVNTTTRNINTWDASMQTRAEQLIDQRLANPVIRQNILNILERGNYGGEREEYHMLDYIGRVEAEVLAAITAMVVRDVPVVANNVGIISATQLPVAAINAPLHVVSTNNAPNTSVNGFNQVRNLAGQTEWVQATLVEQATGFAIIAQNIGAFAFAGRTVSIPGIENVPGGHLVTSLVVRFGLGDIFGHGDVDLHQNATRGQIAASIARLAGAPAGSDITWVAANMQVTLANRNANSLVAQQEAVALVMALYERRTGTRIESMIIRDHTRTAGLDLDTRYAQAVRAAFELGIIDSLQPGAPTTIGDLLEMLAALNARIGL